MFHVVARRLVIVVVLLVVLSVAACAAQYKIHPGALNLTDSTAYDALLVAQTAIDHARMDLKTGQLPEGAKDPLNALIVAYNLARDAWLTYRGAIATDVPAQTYLDQLNRNLSDLTGAIRAFKEAR